MSIGKRAALLMMIGLIFSAQGCAAGAQESQTEAPQATGFAAVRTDPTAVEWPKDKLEMTSGVPSLKVYVADEGAVRQMDIETYVAGVLAGEMKTDWPLEALKAQAILARTFVLKFISEKQSRYAGADVSTDIEEAQAYDAAAVNDRVRQAVSETTGLVLQSDGELPYAWFHAHSGGATALAKEGLDYEKDEPTYTMSAQGMEDDQADKEAASWEATFSFAEFTKACQAQGFSGKVSASASVRIGETGVSGRAITLLVDGQAVKAAPLRIALGSTKMRSTLLTYVRVTEKGVSMAGKGYGHGVGMSQWGAYAMAQGGSQAQEIVLHYFKNVSLVRLWESSASR